MRGWRTQGVLIALLLSACGKVTHRLADEQGPSSTGVGGTSSVGPCVPVDLDGDGISEGCDNNGDGIIDIEYECVWIDLDGDGIADGCDNDGDGIIDIVTSNDDPLPPLPPGCAEPVLPTSQLRRLTKAQYDNTIRDLTGLDTQPSTMLAPDANGSMDERAWFGFRTAAVSVAEQVMANDELRSNLVPCQTADEACATQFIQEFGQRAYRRPLTQAEVERYQNLYDERDQLTENGSFEEALQMLMEVILISPSFLTRTERSQTTEGAYYLLDNWEVASRLSYMLWNSMPDAELFDAAARGALSSQELIYPQAVRMSLDPRARTPMAAFHSVYLHGTQGTQWGVYQRDLEKFPNFAPELIPLLNEETERVFDFVVFDQGGTFSDLLQTPVGFVNADLAPLYGLDPDAFGSELELVQYDPQVRPGVFTRAGFLAANALYDRTNPSLRGAFLLEDVLCVDLPPKSLDGHDNGIVEFAELPTSRERVEATTSPPECIGCHQFIDPPGFVLEGFNAVGEVQTTDNDQGIPVDTSAEVLIGEATLLPVTGPAELMRAIADSPEAMRCYATKWVEHAYQRPANSADQCMVDNLTAQMLQGRTVRDLLPLLTRSNYFRLRALDTQQP